MGGFSAVFDADDVVGLIIRARKPSSAGCAFCGRFVLDGCFFSEFGGGPSDGLLLALLRVEGFLGSPDLDVVVVRLGDRVVLA